MKTSLAGLRESLIRARSSPLKGLGLRGLTVAAFLLYALLRFSRDGCVRHAAGLSYASLLALVPLLAIGFAMLTAFPGIADLRLEIQETIFAFFVPTAGEVINARVAEFVDNASALTGPGIVALAVTAILLLANVNATLNEIWRVREARPWPVQILVYWGLLTLGPLLIGASISVSSYAFIQNRLAPLVTGWDGQGLLTSPLLSLGLSTLGFSIVFFLVPNRRVRPLHAFAGGFTAAALFELLKYGFGIYIAQVPTYQAVYGALAVVPIFLLWMYLSWAVILFGAEIAAALPEWRATRARGTERVGPGDCLVLALSLLARLRRAAYQGVQLRTETLVHGLPATPREVDDILHALRRTRFISRTTTGRWLLARDLAAVSLDDLTAALGQKPQVAEGWSAAAESVMDSLRRAQAPLTKRSLEELLFQHETALEEAAVEEAQERSSVKAMPLRRDR